MKSAVGLTEWDVAEGKEAEAEGASPATEGGGLVIEEGKLGGPPKSVPVTRKDEITIGI